MPPVRPHRQGTVRPDGKWQTVRSVDGVRKTFVQRKSESRRQLAQRADQWAYEQQSSPNKHEVKLSRAIDLYLEFRRGAPIAPDTLEDDQFAGRLLSGVLGTSRIGSIDAIGIDLALRGWKDKPRTAKKVRDFGRKLFNWLIAREWVGKNPFARSTPVPYQADVWQEPMPAEDFEKALAHVRLESLRALYLVLRWTALRPKSVRELSWFEVRDDGETLRIAKAKAKTNAGKRPIMVVEPAASALRSLPRCSEFVFPSTQSDGPFCEEHVIRVWRDAQIAAGLKPRPLYDLKHMRVTELMDLLQRPELVAAMTGLANPSVIETRYVQIEQRKIEEKVKSVKKV